MKEFDLINWLTTHLHNEKLVFDEILYLESFIKDFFIKNNLSLNETDDIFLMRFIIFLYYNSKCE